MRLPTMPLAPHPLKSNFYYQWNSVRRRTNIAVILLVTLLALAVYTTYPLHRLFAAPFMRGQQQTQGKNVKRLALVSAASFNRPELTEESIVTAFGTGLATATQVATGLPLPGNLAGTTVLVRDRAGTTRQAPLFYVSSEQVNFLFPAGTLPGPATVTITAADGSISVGEAIAALVGPGLFAMNANGQGVVAGVVLRVSGTTQTYEKIARFDVPTGKWIATPIDLGPEGDKVFLICYGTGFRNRTSLDNVVAAVGGVNVPVWYAWKQGRLVGLDQVNLELPRSLSGRGEVNVAMQVDGKFSNIVRINIK